jgi:Protein of unknown function (DUF2799)
MRNVWAPGCGGVELIVWGVFMTFVYWQRMVVFAFLFVAACASLTQTECKQSNWFEIGQGDGAKGRTLAVFEDHIEACAEYGIRPNRREYEDGRNFGLARYCTPLSGFKAGRSFQTYQNVCPPESQGEFLRGYELGGQFGQVEKQLFDVNKDIDDIEGSLRKDKLKPDQKESLYKQVDRLRNEKDRLEREIQRIQTVANQTL